MLIAALAASACVITTVTGSASGANVTQLKNKLGSAQSQLNGAEQRAQTLSGSVAALNSQVSSLGTQISLVQSREAAARQRLATDEQRLAATKGALARERRHLAHLRNVLDRAESALKAELVSQYEQPQQSVVSLLVDSSGFQQLVNGLQYLSRAKHQEQTIITVTRAARDGAQTAATRLITLQRNDAQAAGDASTRTNALAGMNALLNSRQAALAHEREAQAATLTASRARGAQLQAAVTTIQKQEAAAEAAARTVTYAPGASLGASGGWSIPYPIVLCESGGQDLPPNSAGASGYYQIMPATWRDFGGTGAAAYLAPKSEQDAVASRVWNNGAGASNWTCAGIVGIS
jgi:septal ring factor EnvC (AmiA/AmiB activator)